MAVNRLDQTDNTPLDRFEVFRSSDCEEVVHQVAQTLADHRMEVRNPSQKLACRMNRVELGACTMSYIQQGVEVSIDAGSFGDRYTLFTDLDSETNCETLGESIAVTRETAGLFSPVGSAHVSLGANAKHLHLTFERATIERHLENLAGVPFRGSLVFEPRFSLSTGGGALLNDLIQLHVRHLDAGNDVLHSPLVVANLEDALMTTLLSFHSHSHSVCFESKPPALVPRQVKLVEDYIYAYAEQPITMKDLVAVTNVSMRSIHYAFRRYRGYSPKSLLSFVRLDRARERLKTADVGENVTKIAFDCGFGHLGRFSADYSKRFGESPSQTLRRRQIAQEN